MGQTVSGRWLIRVAVSAAVIAVLLRLVPLRSVLAALSRVDAWTCAATFILFAAAHCCKAAKLCLLIGPRTAPLSSCLRAQYAGLASNLGLPGLAGGDLVRAAYLTPTVGTKRVALASVADRAIDAVIMVALIAGALPFAGVPRGYEGAMTTLMWLLAALGGALTIAGLVLWLRPHQTVTDLLAFLRVRRGALLAAAAISVLVQAALVLNNVWLGRQVGIALGVAPWFVAWPMSKVIALLPISFGGLGVREAALVSLLTPYGAPREAVLASGFLWQGVLTITALTGVLVTQIVPQTIRSSVPADAPVANA